MVKVPATPEGIPAIRALTARGINVNITLLFAVPVYEQVADAYLSGLEDHAAARRRRLARRVGGELLREPDRRGGRRAPRRGREAGPTAERRSLARGLEGKVAIANAKLAYEHYKEIFASDRWKALAATGRPRAAAAVGEHEHEEPRAIRTCSTSRS